MTSNGTPRVNPAHQITRVHRIPDYRHNAGSFPIPQPQPNK